MSSQSETSAPQRSARWALNRSTRSGVSAFSAGSRQRVDPGAPGFDIGPAVWRHSLRCAAEGDRMPVGPTRKPLVSAQSALECGLRQFEVLPTQHVIDPDLASDLQGTSGTRMWDLRLPYRRWRPRRGSLR
jgi:hypothetical protein